MIPHLDLILGAIILLLLFLLVFKIIKKIVVTAVMLCIFCVAMYWFSTTDIYREKVAPMFRSDRAGTTKTASPSPAAQ